MPVFLQVLYECHLQHPEQTFIFSMPSMTLSARYGATTGMKTAFLPRNFKRMSAMEQQACFDYMEPFRIIDDSFNYTKCIAHDQ